MPVPEGTRCLVLNNDRTPLNSIHWKKAIKRMYANVRCEHCKRGIIQEDGRKVPCSYCNGRGKMPPAEVIEFYEIYILDSAGRIHFIPAVIANRHHAKRVFKKVPFSRVNIYRRDNYTCQYCGHKCAPHELTLDHVIPRSMWKGPGSPTDWSNIVTSCRKCNTKKDNKTPEQAGMSLRKIVNGQLITYKYPKQASSTEMILGVQGGRCPEEWETYVKHLLSSVKTS